MWSCVTQPSRPAFQVVGGERIPVPAAYRIDGNCYTFELGAYDRTRELVIDPLLASTYLGGGGNDGEWLSATLVVDGNGSVYVADRNQQVQKFRQR